MNFTLFLKKCSVSATKRSIHKFLENINLEYYLVLQKNGSLITYKEKEAFLVTWLPVQWRERKKARRGCIHCVSRKPTLPNGCISEKSLAYSTSYSCKFGEIFWPIQISKTCSIICFILKKQTNCLRYALKKNDIIWEFFPTWRGVFPNPKTFVCQFFVVISYQFLHLTIIQGYLKLSLLSCCKKNTGLFGNFS